MSSHYLAQGVNRTPPPSINPGQPNYLTNPLLPSNLQFGTGVEFIQKLLSAAISLAFLIGVLFFFFTLIMGAIQWITSGGDKAAVESARGKVTNAMIGIIILFSVYALVSLVETFFGVNLLILDIDPLRIR